MKDIKQQAVAWLEHIHSGEMVEPIIPSIHHALALKSSQSVVQNPSCVYPTPIYENEESGSASSGTSPVSLAEGLQTVVNLCRISVGFDPLDPEGNGDLRHYLQFTTAVYDVPFLTHEWSYIFNFGATSQDPNDLVKMFVNSFIGISEEDKEAIEKSVGLLVDAALSYAGKVQTESNFCQNILDMNNDGSKAYCNFYSSLFSIYCIEDKGCITFYSYYIIMQESFSLTQSSWDSVKSDFADELKVTLEEWIEYMTTPRKPNSRVKALCLIDK